MTFRYVLQHFVEAFELFLSRNPSWVGKVTLIQVGVPTRVDVAEYQTLAKHVNELVGRINGVYGTLEYSPIHYINQFCNFENLIFLLILGLQIMVSCIVSVVRKDSYYHRK